MDNPVMALLAIGLVVWTLWMMTCRPDDYNKLADSGMQRLERAASGAGKFAWFCFKNYRRFR
jgi:hypothetical protein